MLRTENYWDHGGGGLGEHFSIYDNDRLLIRKIEEGCFSGPNPQTEFFKENKSGLVSNYYLRDASPGKNFGIKKPNLGHNFNITIKKQNGKQQK